MFLTLSLRLMARSVPDMSHHFWCLADPSSRRLSRQSHRFAKILNFKRSCLPRAAVEGVGWEGSRVRETAGVLDSADGVDATFADDDEALGVCRVSGDVAAT